MQDLTAAGRRVVDELAQRHRVPVDAVETLLAALIAGGGTQAQFDHPQLGGMGQWSSGGMVMVGDMFNHGLKQKVDAICAELSEALRRGGMVAPTPGRPGDVAGHTSSRPAAWPMELGAPSSTGSQNNMRYAVFPSTRRLAVERGGRVTVYDTGEHRISGVSQQQSHDQSLAFTSQHGAVRVEDLTVVAGPGDAPTSGDPPHVERRRPASPDDEASVFAKIERLHELRVKNIITEQEFDAKKAELLGRI